MTWTAIGSFDKDWHGGVNELCYLEMPSLLDANKNDRRMESAVGAARESKFIFLRYDTYVNRTPKTTALLAGVWKGDSYEKPRQTVQNRAVSLTALKNKSKSNVSRWS